eukprot:UN20105
MTPYDLTLTIGKVVRAQLNDEAFYQITFGDDKMQKVCI